MDQTNSEIDKKPAIIISERPGFMEPAPTISPKSIVQFVSNTVKLKTD